MGKHDRAAALAAGGDGVVVIDDDVRGAGLSTHATLDGEGVPKCVGSNEDDPRLSNVDGQGESKSTELGDESEPKRTKFEDLEEALERGDLSVIPKAVEVLTSGAPDLKERVASAIANITPASVDKDGSIKTAIGAAGAMSG